MISGEFLPDRWPPVPISIHILLFNVIAYISAFQIATTPEKLASLSCISRTLLIWPASLSD